jgi:hypothetical protein
MHSTHPARPHLHGCVRLCLAHVCAQARQHLPELAAIQSAVVIQVVLCLCVACVCACVRVCVCAKGLQHNRGHTFSRTAQCTHKQQTPQDARAMHALRPRTVSTPAHSHAPAQRRARCCRPPSHSCPRSWGQSRPAPQPCVRARLCVCVCVCVCVHRRGSHDQRSPQMHMHTQPSTLPNHTHAVPTPMRLTGTA